MIFNNILYPKHLRMLTFLAHGKANKMENLGSSYTEIIEIDAGFIDIEHYNACGWLVLCKILNEGSIKITVSELKNKITKIKGFEAYQPLDKMIDYLVISKVAEVFGVRILVYVINTQKNDYPCIELHMYGKLEHSLLKHAMVLDYHGRHFYCN